MSLITNKFGVPLALAVWAVDDDYDYIREEGYISATSLLKPIRAITLTPRVPASLRVQEDVVDFVARGLGNSIHGGVEKAWTQNYRKNLRKLGYNDDVIDAVRINPDPKEVTADILPIYVEQRAIKEIVVGGELWKVGGKFDLCIQGILQDTKTTSTFKYVKGETREYMLQGSIYRWLHPDKITSNFIRICFVFTDWMKSRANDPNYPSQRVLSIDVELMSIEETERWVRNRISLIQQFRGVPETAVPHCTPEELWVDPTVYKYYSNPLKLDRATKNFDTDKAGAYAYLASQGKGIVREIAGTPKRCGYCSAQPICTQGFKQ